VLLALHLSIDQNLLDKEIWQAIEDAAYPAMHHMNLT